MRRLSMRLIVGLTIALTILVAALAYSTTRALAQSEIVSDLTERLTQQGVPLKSVVVTGQTPLSLEITLQSASDSSAPAREDGFYFLDVRREVLQAERRGFRVSHYRIVLVNAHGATIHTEEERGLTFYALPDLRPATAGNEDIARYVRANLDAHGMSLAGVSVNSTAHGFQTLTISLSVPDLETANRALPGFMPSLHPFLEQANAEAGAQITVCWVDLVSDDGAPLLKYVLDRAIGSERWWMADGLTQDWFPHPPNVDELPH
jgi:hypothetical protein